jgi:hypothetical protein
MNVFVDTGFMKLSGGTDASAVPVAKHARSRMDHEFKLRFPSTGKLPQHYQRHWELEEGLKLGT